MITYSASQVLSYEDVDKALFLLSARTRPNIEFAYKADHLTAIPEITEAALRLKANKHYSAYVPLEFNAGTNSPYWRIIRMVNKEVLCR